MWCGCALNSWQEEDYRRRMHAKFAEDERKEKEGEMRRQENQKKFHQEVSDLAQVKRGMYEEQRAREVRCVVFGDSPLLLPSKPLPICRRLAREAPPCTRS